MSSAIAELSITTIIHLVSHDLTVHACDRSRGGSAKGHKDISDRRYIM